MAHLRASKREIERFRDLIRSMGYDSEVYRMVREELIARGNWRNRPRGNPKLGFLVARRPKQAKANSALDDY